AERLYRSRGVQHSGFAVDDGVACATLPESDDGQPGGLRLDGHDSEVLESRKQQRSGLGEQARNLVVADVAEKRRVPAAETANVFEIAALSRDEQRPAERLARLNRSAHPLVRHDPSEHEVGVARMAG